MATSLLASSIERPLPGAMLKEVKISMGLQLHFVGVGNGVVGTGVGKLLGLSL